jgi:integrase
MAVVPLGRKLCVTVVPRREMAAQPEIDESPGAEPHQQPLNSASQQGIAECVLPYAPATPPKRRRGRSMSRRSGQVGSISVSGKWWRVRFWMDVEGQEQRQYMSERICPVSGPGALTESERKRRAKRIVEASGANSEETLVKSIASVQGTTFRHQASAWLTRMKKQNTAPSTLETWESCVEKWLNPNIGELPLSAIKRTVVQDLIDKMVASRLAPKSIANYFQVVKMVIASRTNEDGEELHPRSWAKMQLVIPKVIKKKQHRPSVDENTVNGLIAGSHGTQQMLFILLAASGLRIGEALGVRIENIKDNGTCIVIKSKVCKGIEQDFLKTSNGEREIDLPKSVAKLLMDYIGQRKSGLLLCSRNGKPLSESNIINRWLHPMLEKMNAPVAGNHAFRRFRITHLRKNYVPRDLEHFWMGHADEEIGDLYSKLMHDLSYRKDVAERIGTGFDVPEILNTKAELNLVEPKIAVDDAVEVAVNC